MNQITAGFKSRGGSAAGRGLGACYGLAEVGLGSEPGKEGLIFGVKI